MMSIGASGEVECWWWLRGGCQKTDDNPLLPAPFYTQFPPQYVHLERMNGTMVEMVEYHNGLKLECHNGWR